MSSSSDQNLALFCDFENIALGVRDEKQAKFDINWVLERLLVKGSIVVKKAYCDWGRYKEFKATMHEAAFRAHRHSARATIRQEFRGHSHGRRCARPVLHQVACQYVRDHQRRLRLFTAGQQAARKRQDRDRCRRQEFDVGSADQELRRIHLLRRHRSRTGAEKHAPKPTKGRKTKRKTAKSKPKDNKQEGIDQALEVAAALNAERGDQDKLWGSMVKQALKRVNPSFNEGYFGFESFSNLLEEAQARGQLDLELDERSGGYIIRNVIR